MKLIKWVSLGFLALMLLVFAIVGVGLATLDLNDYKQQIQTQVKAQTGRSLAIDGELGYSLFPWLGITIEQVTLENAKGFGESPFAHVGKAEVHVELLPLLSREISIDVVRLVDLELNLAKNSKGISNWDDLLTAKADDNPQADAEQETSASSPPAIAGFAINGLEISNANVNWHDQQAKVDAALSAFNLRSGRVELDKAFPLSLSFEMQSRALGLNAKVEGESDVMLSLAQQHYQLNGLSLKMSAKGKALPVKSLQLSLSTDLDAKMQSQTIDAKGLAINLIVEDDGFKQKEEMALSTDAHINLDKQQASLRNVSGNLLDAALSGKVDITKLLTAPQVAGQIALDGFNPKASLPRLNIALPATSDQNVLQKLALSLSFQADSKRVDLADLVIQLDDTTLKGKASVANFSKPKIRYDLAVDAIDVDRYLPATTASAQPATPSAPAQAGGDVVIELPNELLRSLDVVGSLNVGRLKVSQLTMTDLKTPLSIQSGVVRLKNAAAKLYEGTLQSTVVVNAKTATPAFSTTTSLKGIQAGPLLADLIGEDKLAGRGNFQLQINTQGKSVNQLKKGLNGKTSFRFEDGALKGINIGYEVRRAKALLSGQKLSEDDKLKQTDFALLSASAAIKNGVVNNQDLLMKSPLLRIKGAGKVDLPKEYIDYKAKILVSKTSEGQGGAARSELDGLRISLPIRGKFDALSADFMGAMEASVKEEVKARLKAEEDKLKAELKKKEAAEKARLEKKVAAEKERAKERLKEKEDELKQELEDKLKEKLKKLF